MPPARLVENVLYYILGYSTPKYMTSHKSLIILTQAELEQITSTWESSQYLRGISKRFDPVPT